MLPGSAVALAPLMGIVAPSIFSGGIAVPVLAVVAAGAAAVYGTVKAGDAIYKAKPAPGCAFPAAPSRPCRSEHFSGLRSVKACSLEISGYHL